MVTAVFVRCSIEIPNSIPNELQAKAVMDRRRTEQNITSNCFWEAFIFFLFLFRLLVTLCTILRAHIFHQNPASRCPIEFQDSMHSGSPNSTPRTQVSVPNPDEPLASLALLASWARPRSYQYLSLKDLHGILLFIRNTLFGEWPFYFLCRLHTSVRTETGSMESLELNDDVAEGHGMECCRGHTFLPSHLF